jgi:hypothetical protein
LDTGDEYDYSFTDCAEDYHSDYEYDFAWALNDETWENVKHTWDGDFNLKFGPNCDTVEIVTLNAKHIQASIMSLIIGTVYFSF